MVGTSSSAGSERALRAACACAGIVFLAYGCASAPRAADTSRTAGEGAGVSTANDRADALPALPVAQVTEGGQSTPRIQRFDAVEQDLRTALRGLAQSFGLGLEIDPDVHGLVNTRLENVTLDEALASLLVRHSYAYQIQGGVLRVTGSRMQSKTFALDYVSLNRLGSTSTVLTSRLGGSTLAGNQQQQQLALGGGGGGGSVSIQSTTAANLWQDVRIALEALVFYDMTTDTLSRQIVSATSSETAVPVAGVPISAANSVLGAAAGAPGATAKTSSDGRRLIINPLAGSVFVTAPPATLALVESYVASFQASVQRQVLVEAKIVRVTLSKEFRFGIDWNLLGRAGGLQPQPGTVASTNTFAITLGGGASLVRATLTALESQGDVAVLSSPMITALNNQMAVFDATDDEIFFAVTSTPIIGPNGGIVATSEQVQPQQISVGIVLNILAQIGADGIITMQVRPQLSEVARIDSLETREGTKTTAPVISRRETDTMARVRDGETIVIGGLTQTRRDRTRSGVPGLRRIPGVGGLFGSRADVEEKDELVIFLTPTIIVGARPTSP